VAKPGERMKEKEMRDVYCFNEDTPRGRVKDSKVKVTYTRKRAREPARNLILEERDGGDSSDSCISQPIKFITGRVAHTSFLASHGLFVLHLSTYEQVFRIRCVSFWASRIC
jgi:hypothetical protein